MDQLTLFALLSLFICLPVTLVNYGKEFELVPYSNDQKVVRNFLAQLRWMTSKPTPGPFNAAAAIEIYYK